MEGECSTSWHVETMPACRYHAYYVALRTCIWAEAQKLPTEKMAGQHKGRLREGWAINDSSCEKSPR